MNDKPDYKKYTYFQLLDSLDNIDQETYPERTEEIRSEIHYLQSRFPVAKHPTINTEIDETGLLTKNIRKFFGINKKLVKTYGSIEAEISPSNTDIFQQQAVSAAFIIDEGEAKLQLSGDYELMDSYREVKIAIGRSGVTRLKQVLERFEQDVEDTKT